MEIGIPVPEKKYDWSTPPPVGNFTDPIIPVAVPVKVEQEAKMDSEPAPVEKQPDIIPVNTEMEDSTSRLWWLILGSALFLITVLCAYLAWDIVSNRNKLNELKQIYPDPSTSAALDTSNAVTDSAKENIVSEDIDSAITDSQSETVTEPQPSTQGNESDCFVVVGAFGDPANVTRMVERLESMGYGSEQIKGNVLTKVAIRTSCDPVQLQKTLNEARSNINPEAWIL